MADYFNDSPIETSAADEYGVTVFSQSLAKSILTIKKPVGTTIALHGPWGAGKSSVVNLIRNELKKCGDETLAVTEFKCWWYRGEDALALAFFQNLHAVLRNKLGDKVKDFLPKIGRGLLQAGPVIGPAVALATSGPLLGSLASGSASFAKRFFPEGETLEQTFQKLAKILEGEERRFLVIIDDIDRLDPDESLAIFRLVKSVGHLPNVMYLLVFDRALAEKNIADRYPSEGPHFLEKIIQAGFELPEPLQLDLNMAILSAIEEICGDPGEPQMSRVMNNYYDVVVPFISTPRHVTRYKNAISVTWPAIAHDIALADFIALEAIRLYEPSLFQAIRSNKETLCGLDGNDNVDRRDDARFNSFLVGIDEQRHETAKIALQRLFPRLEGVGYSGEFSAVWDEERRVCIDKHFETYFRLSLSESTLSSEAVAELVTRADDCEFVQLTLRTAARATRKNSASLVPVYLDELTTNARKIAKEKVGPLLAALFEIHDEIDQERDKERGFYALADTSLRYHWLIRRLTADRYTLRERTELYRSTIKSSSLGWLVDFTSSAKDDYREREDGPQDEDRCLVAEDAVPHFVDIALNAIRSAAKEDRLARHPDLIFILYRWRDFMENDPTEVREWTDSAMNEDHALVAIAAGLTGESWSFGMGGFGSLGDRVSRRSVRAQIPDDIDILDAAHFRERLELCRDSGQLSEKHADVINTFLEAWDRRLRGENR